MPCGPVDGHEEQAFLGLPVVEAGIDRGSAVRCVATFTSTTAYRRQYQRCFFEGAETAAYRGRKNQRIAVGTKATVGPADRDR